MKCAIVLFLFAILFMVLGEKVAPVEEQVSPRFVFTPDGCHIDWPQFAKVCHYVDNDGNRIIHTKF